MKNEADVVEISFVYDSIILAINFFIRNYLPSFYLFQLRIFSLNAIREKHK